MEDVYRPAEDSYLLAKHVESLVSGNVLDMGTGSGIQAVTAAMKPEVESVLAVDINPEALKEAKKRAVSAGISSKLSFLRSDLFDEVNGRYNWIIFNSPYLPSEGEADEHAWAGGAELIERFLIKTRNHLEPRGSILLIYSNLSEPDLSGYSVELLEEIGLFFEKLYCVRLSPI
ncbi:methyltransferase [Candidatus Bathyarchaeota archaeon]|nr:methyltransferase [Candidatus Bathyarchaeota archaeon]